MNYAKPAAVVMLSVSYEVVLTKAAHFPSR